MKDAGLGADTRFSFEPFAAERADDFTIEDFNRDFRRQAEFLDQQTGFADEGTEYIFPRCGAGAAAAESLLGFDEEAAGGLAGDLGQGDNFGNCEAVLLEEGRELALASQQCGRVDGDASGVDAKTGEIRIVSGKR